MTVRYLSLREQGKAGYLLTFDVARAAARRLGTLLTARSVLADPEDIFHLSYDEFRAGCPAGAVALVGQRRTLFDARQNLRLPQAWEGLPTVSACETATVCGAAVGTVITGVAASGGTCVGRARVVTDPATVDLDDGDVLVCEATDPGWISLFLVAGAVVTDHGGMLSHGAIVARELGLPCVCGTTAASRRIADGQQIRVDGDRGTVEVLSLETAVAVPGPGPRMILARPAETMSDL
ncbi:MAG: PEP-utilizing enzyme [Sporichthyaceae bacterium]